MKKIIPLLIFAFVTLTSCSTDDDPTVFYEILEITQVSDAPQTFTVGQSDTLQVSYKRPSSCHGLQGFDVRRDGEIRNIAIIGVVFEDSSANCENLDNDIRTTPIIFKPEVTGDITLNFFAGDNTDGVPEYITLTIPVIE